MDIRKVKKLMEMLEESSLSELEVIEGEESIRLSKSSNLTTENIISIILMKQIIFSPMSILSTYYTRK